MFKKILIANRGEIAVRVIRTCRDMGISTVAVYSDADKESLHVKYADEAVHIGSFLARKSYLNIDKIVQAAKETGADAIHPGYGFLSENALFAEACIVNKIAFIGPSPETHLQTGKKITAKEFAIKAGIPVCTGSKGVISSDDETIELAREIGFPVIVKASGGGGGKGMRIAENEQELLGILRTARGEAMASFNDPDLYLEKFIKEPRHIEFQILGDQFGNYLHLGERECSIQRNYQKLVEESPSPFLDDELRKKMGEAAIRVMRSVNYLNAGTVEFLVDADKNFYFNEINSRLQVEHPVTEMVTGIDMVRQQLLIAAGQSMDFENNTPDFKGWSIECRINAEDTNNDFTPSPGKIENLILPGGLNVRVDTHIYPGYEIPPFYDSMVGKLIVWGRNRDEAVTRMQRALDEFTITGIETTIPFHKKILANNDFRRGNFTTNFIHTL